MADRIIYLLIALMAGFLAGSGDIFLNYWAKEGSKAWFIWGLLLFNASILTFAGVLKRGYLAESVVIYIVANVLLVMAFSHFFLQEPIHSYRLFWLFVAVIAVVTMELL